MKIAVLDRYPSTGKAVEDILRRERPTLTYCGQACLPIEGDQLLQTEHPNILLLEPLIFGTQILQLQMNLGRLRSLYPSTKLVVITSSAVQEHLRIALRAGVSDYLYKPIHWPELLGALDQLCGTAPEDSGSFSSFSVGHNVQANATLVQLIHQGLEADALDFLHGMIRAMETQNYAEQCILFMDIATQVVHMPDDIDQVPEDLITIYQEFIKYVSRHNRIDQLHASMEQFVIQSAAIFNRFSRDQGYHQIQDVLRSVDEHLSEELSLKRISSELFISTTYFSRLFRAKTGQKFSEYLALRRIERAKLLLVSSAMPIAEIARAVGYPEANSFARLFKAYTNMTPVQYRKQGGAK